MKLALVNKNNQVKRDMPSENGFVILWRDINKQSWSNESLPYAVFTKLLTQVQHKPYVAEVNGIKTPLQAGEIAMSYDKITQLFKEIKDKSHARRIIKKFKSLSQIYTREIKKGNVNYGFVVGFVGWEKWQNCDTPSDTPSDTPKATNIKALSTIRDTPSDTQRNNNVLNKLKDNACFDNKPVLETFLQERTDAFEDFWKTYSESKVLIGGKNKAPKAKTKSKFLNETFPASKIRSMGLEAFDQEVESLLDLVWLVYSDIAQHKKTNTRSDWFNHENMWPAKFLSNAQWRDEA